MNHPDKPRDRTLSAPLLRRNTVVVGPQVRLAGRIQPGRRLAEQAHERNLQGARELLTRLKDHVGQTGERERLSLEFILCVDHRQTLERLACAHEIQLRLHTLKRLAGIRDSGPQTFDHHDPQVRAIDHLAGAESRGVEHHQPVP